MAAEGCERADSMQEAASVEVFGRTTRMWRTGAVLRGGGGGALRTRVEVYTGSFLLDQGPENAAGILDRYHT